MVFLKKRTVEYDAWIHWAINDVCNIDCIYCYRDKLKTKNKKIDISNLTKTLDKTNKVYKITFTGGGEPFLVPNIIETCVELTKRHYIDFTTNLTSPKVREFSEKIDPKRVYSIIASCHIKELERLNLMERYIEHFHLLKNKGFPIKAVEVGHPSILPEAEKFKKFFADKGVLLLFSHFQGVYNGKRYPHSYTKEELKIIGNGFGFVKIDAYFPKGKLCNAGYNAAMADVDGNIQTCDFIKEDLGNIRTEIKFKKSLIKCPKEYCDCPLNVFDENLFNKTLKENKSILSRHIFPWIRGFKNSDSLLHFSTTLKTSLLRAKNEIKTNNKKTPLGIFWYLINPLLLFLLLLLLFSDFFSGIALYPAYLLTGVLLFHVFSKVTSESAAILTKSKPERPKTELMFTIFFKHLYSHIFEVILLAIILILLGVPLFGLLLYPLPLLFLSFFTFGLSLFLSGLTVYVVDLGNIWAFLSRLLWFATPIFYEIGNQSKLFFLNLINPLYYFITLTRDLVVYTRMPELWVVGGALFYAVVSLFFGIMVFQKLQTKFAERVETPRKFDERLIQISVN